MVKEQMVSCTRLKIVSATQKFIANYFDDEIVALSINSSQASKTKTDKGYFKIDFVYEGTQDKVPQFLEKEDYVSQFKKEFSEWLDKEVKYFYVEWSLNVDKSDKKKEALYSFSFSIELRL